TQQHGLIFQHRTGATGKQFMPEIMCGGAALVDFNGDGRLDAYLTNGTENLPAYDSSTQWTNQLLPQGNNAHFAPAVGMGATDAGYGMGVAVADVNRDGRIDIFVTNYGPDRLYINEGEFSFRDASQDALPPLDGWSASAAFLDYDRDGWLDLYITRYLDNSSPKSCKDRAGRPNYCSPQAFPPAPDVLLRNVEGKRFEDVSHASGIRTVAAAAGLGVTCADFDQDGWVDIYVANDGYPNHLWHNRGDGTFVEIGMTSRAALNAQGSTEAGMGVVAADFDHDGWTDLFVTHLTNESNTLYRNLGGDRGFEDRSMQSGLSAASVPYTGFGTAAFDVELDGDLDLLIANGRVTRSGSPPEETPSDRVTQRFRPYAEPNHLYLNNGAGSFIRSDKCGQLCDAVEVSRGLATGDIDADGDLDVLVMQAEGPARLFRNDAPRSGDWLIIRPVVHLDGNISTPDLGATVVVSYGQTQQSRVISSAAGYLTAVEPVAHFGLPKGLPTVQFVVHWTDGTKESFVLDKFNQSVEIVRGSGQLQR
ncbi:MAG: CRTAC1 family protein, partial [Phycisphaerae bacterium]